MADRALPQLVRQEGGAGDTVELAKSVIEVRELVETFRSQGVIGDGWVEIVRSAVAKMTMFERRHPGTLPTIAPLAADLETLLDLGGGVDAQLLDTVSAGMAELLPAVLPAGIPRPDDEQNWAFST